MIAVFVNVVGILLNMLVLHAFFTCKGREFKKHFMYVINMSANELLLTVTSLVSWVLFCCGYYTETSLLAFRADITTRCAGVCCCFAFIIMTFDVAFAVLMPLKHKLISKKKTTVVITATWISGLLFLFPYMLIRNFIVCKTVMYSVQISIDVLVVLLAIITYNLIGYQIRENRNNVLHKDTSDKQKQVLWVASLIILILIAFLLIPDVIEFIYFTR